MGSWARRRPLKDPSAEAASAPVLAEAPVLSPRLSVVDEQPQSPALSARASFLRPSKPSLEKPLHDVAFAPPFNINYPPNESDFARAPAQVPSADGPEAGVRPFQPEHAAMSRQRSSAGRQDARKCTIVWVVPLIIVVCVTLFIITMYKNNCPHQSPPVSCIATWLGRLSFQPWSENPLLGPSADTLQRMGGLSSSSVHHGGGWRLLTAMWLHAGVFHVLVNMAGVVVVGLRLEKDFGAVRLIVLYFLSGVGGALMSALFLEDVVSVGASGALFGLLGATLSDLLTNWTLYASKCCSLLSLLILIAVNLAFGLTPQVDNFCHIGGLLTGFLLGFVLYVKPQFRWLYRDHAVAPVLPYMNVEQPKVRKHKTYQYVLQVVALLIFLALFIAAVASVFSGVDGNHACSWCHYLSCVDTPLWSCKNAGGQQVSCTTTSYTNGTGTVGCADGSQYWVPNYPSQSEAQLQQICAKQCA